MRSDSVVLPESIWAEMPMFRMTLMSFATSTFLKPRKRGAATSKNPREKSSVRRLDQTPSGTPFHLFADAPRMPRDHRRPARRAFAGARPHRGADSAGARAGRRASGLRLRPLGPDRRHRGRGGASVDAPDRAGHEPGVLRAAVDVLHLPRRKPPR